MLLRFYSILYHSQGTFSPKFCFGKARVPYSGPTDREGLLDLANKNTGCPVTFEFQINKVTVFGLGMSSAIFELYYFNKLFVSLKLKCKWASCL